MQSGVNSQSIRSGTMNDNEWMGIIESADTIAKSKLIIDDTSNISISDLRAKCQKYKMEQDLSVIIIDYLQLMKGRDRAELFFATPFWKKLQTKNGQLCMSKMDNVATGSPGMRSYQGNPIAD